MIYTVHKTVVTKCAGQIITLGAKSRSACDKTFHLSLRPTLSQRVSLVLALMLCSDLF